MTHLTNHSWTQGNTHLTCSIHMAPRMLSAQEQWLETRKLPHNRNMALRISAFPQPRKSSSSRTWEEGGHEERSQACSCQYLSLVGVGGDALSSSSTAQQGRRDISPSPHRLSTLLTAFPCFKKALLCAECYVKCFPCGHVFTFSKNPRGRLIAFPVYGRRNGD